MAKIKVKAQKIHYVLCCVLCVLNLIQWHTERRRVKANIILIVCMVLDAHVHM